VARYGQAFKDKAVARLLPPESAAPDVVARDMGVGVGTLQRWREEADLPQVGCRHPQTGAAWLAQRTFRLRQHAV